MSTVVNIAFVVNGQPAGSGVFTPAAAPLVAPVPAGTLLGTIAISPTNWVGSFTPSGPDAAAVVIAGAATPGVFNVNAAVALTQVRTYSLSQTAFP